MNKDEKIRDMANEIREYVRGKIRNETMTAVSIMGKVSDDYLMASHNGGLAKHLYNKGYRRIADDEIVIKKDEYEAEQEKAFLEWRDEYDQNCLLRLRVSELEKEIEKLKAQNETLELYNKDLKYTNKEFVKVNKAFAKRNDELLDELQECTDIKAKAKQETAREILQYLKRFVGWNKLDVLCKLIADKYGL